MLKKVIYYFAILLFIAGCTGKTPPTPTALDSSQKPESGRKKIHLKAPQNVDQVQVQMFEKKELTEEEIKQKEERKQQRLARKEKKRKQRKKLKRKPIQKPKPFVVSKKDRVPVQITLDSLAEEVSWPIYRKPRVDTPLTPPPVLDESNSRLAIQLNRNFGEWTSETNPERKGEQLLFYYTIGHSKPKYGATLVGSWVTTSYSYRDAAMTDLDLGTMLDSTISTYYKFDNLLGFGVRTGIDINLPTGKGSFTGEEQTAIYPMSSIASELFTVSSYGTGFNIAPNFVAIKPFGKKTAIGLGLRYEYTGEYDATTDIPDDNLDPGDTLMLIGSLQRVLGSTTFFLLDYSSVFATRDTMGGQDAFKQGTSSNYSLKIIKKFSKFRTTLGGSLGTQEKSEGYDGTSFTTEEMNSNNNRQEAFLNFLFPFSKKFAVTAIALYKEVLKNEYVPGDLLFDAGYNATRYGLGLSYKTSSGLVITSSVRKLELNNNADSQEVVDTKYNALTGDIGVIYFVAK